MHRLPLIYALAAMLAAGLCACSPDPGEPAAGPDIDKIAREYVTLVLALGEHDPNYVDAYYGPDAWRAAAREQALSLAEIRDGADELSTRAAVAPANADDPLAPLRGPFLAKQLTAVATRADMLLGREFSFDQETAALYDATSPPREQAYFDRILAEIDALLPGDESLPERVRRFRNQFIIPPDRLAAVFDAAIEACRERTVDHVTLPANERFTVEFVSDQPWGGYNWFQGDADSLIQINTDLPIYIDRAVDLGCHEGYPGHHTFNALLESRLVRERGWIEFSVYPLFSPMSLIAEGSANYGQKIAFPGASRVRFEQDVLFPLAGLDASDADRYYRLEELRGRLTYAGNEAARQYLQGQMDREATVDYLVRNQLVTPEAASKKVDFIDRYRSYVINYNVGRDLVGAYVERLAGDDPERRWAVFVELISSPRLPSDLLE
ncbi:MAG: hypothetical protein WBN65_13745 [Gammaproteobacteria bacterium]